MAGGNPGFFSMDIDTKRIRRSLLRITQKYTDKRMAQLSDDVMALCDAYDESNSLQSLIVAGQSSIDHSLNVLETLRANLRK